MSAPRTIFLADYQPFPFLLPQVELTFRLAAHTTRVLSRLHFAMNPAVQGRHDLRLDGEGLRLISARITGVEIAVELGDGWLHVHLTFFPCYFWKGGHEHGTMTAVWGSTEAGC